MFMNFVGRIFEKNGEGKQRFILDIPQNLMTLFDAKDYAYLI